MLGGKFLSSLVSKSSPGDCNMQLELRTIVLNHGFWVKELIDLEMAILMAYKMPGTISSTTLSSHPTCYLHSIYSCIQPGFIKHLLCAKC